MYLKDGRESRSGRVLQPVTFAALTVTCGVHLRGDAQENGTGVGRESPLDFLQEAHVVEGAGGVGHGGHACFAFRACYRVRVNRRIFPHR